MGGGRSKHCNSLVMARHLALFLLALQVAAPVFAATTVGGSISGPVTWHLADSPVTVESDLLVDGGGVLTIEPGVTVYLNSNVNFTLANGAVNALGTAVSPITITSVNDQPGRSPAQGDWGELRFFDGTNDVATRLEHVNIRYGKGLVIQSASPNLSHLKVSHHLGAAIRMDLNSSPAGIGNAAVGNDLNGIEVPAGDIIGTVAWKLQGIPYVVRQGSISIGQSPQLFAATPNSIQQGRSTDTLLSGVRLDGVENIAATANGLNLTLNGSATATTVPIRITATDTATLGPATIELQTAAGKVRLDHAITVIPYKPDLIVSGMTPNSIRRGESKHVQVTGEQLQGVEIAAPANAGLSISNLNSTPTQADFDLAANATAALGVQTLTFTNPNSNGSATAGINVIRGLPELYLSPNPAAIPPDGKNYAVAVGLTEPDVVDRVVQLSIANTAIAQIAPATVTIPAGQASVQVQIKGVSAGNTNLLMSADGLAQINIPVIVNASTAGINFAVAGIGVVKGSANAVPEGTAAFAASATLGLVKGSPNITPEGSVGFAAAAPLGLLKGGANLIYEGMSGFAVSQPLGVNKQ